jgi:hypothetical protein
MTKESRAVHGLILRNGKGATLGDGFDGLPSPWAERFGRLWGP